MLAFLKEILKLLSKNVSLSKQYFCGMTTIKDTWTKPRGRLEARVGGGFGWGAGGGWGENADNCN